MGDTASGVGRGVFWGTLAVFGGVAGWFLWVEHRAHVMGALPVLLLLVCVVAHLWMHRGHGAAHGGGRR